MVCDVNMRCLTVSISSCQFHTTICEFNFYLLHRLHIGDVSLPGKIQHETLEYIEIESFVADTLEIQRWSVSLGVLDKTLYCA